MAAAVAARAAIPPFQAQWNNENEHLKPGKQVPPTLIEKICRVVWNILSILIFPIGIARLVGWSIGLLSNMFVLPSVWAYSHEVQSRSIDSFNNFWFGPVNETNREMRGRYEVEQHEILTPDGAKLNAYHFKHRLADAHTDTLLFFQSNASFSQQEIPRWLIHKAAERNSDCNFVAFDYRGTVMSKGNADEIRPLILDGESAYQFVRDELHVPLAQIRMYGWSLGGLISGNIKALHPECNADYVNERSLNEIAEVAKQKILELLEIPKCLTPLFCWIPYAIKKKKWNLAIPIDKVQGRMMIVVHKNDPTIPYGASSHLAAKRSNLSFQSIELFQTPEQMANPKKWPLHHHCEPLGNYMANPGQTADNAIADFILPPPAAAAQQIA